MHILRRSLPALVFVLLTIPVGRAQTPLRLVNVAPCRMVDTRPHPIQGGTAAVFDLRSLAQQGGAYGTCPHFDLSLAQAYSLNVTLVPNGNPVGYLTIWPTGEPQPAVSLMNSLDGRTKANAAIVPAGTNGEVSVFVSNTTDVVIDIDAYFESAGESSALAFFPLAPCRVVDTRYGNGGPLGQGETRSFPIPGSCEIPGSAQAYSFNFTVVPTHGPLGYLSVWPTGQPQPSVSTINDPTGTTEANAAIVPAGTGGAISVFASNPTQVLIDVDGYFAPASSGQNPLSLYALTPCRILDTRQTFGYFSGTLPVAVVGSQCGIPGVSSAFVLNATVVPQSQLGYLTLWPEGEDQPVVSTLNAVDGAITSNMAIVPAGTGNESIDAFASNNTQLILDISSYFAAVGSVNIDTASLPDGTLSTGYSATLVAHGGIAPYSWTKTSGTLPAGLSLSTAGVISGTTTATGTSHFTVQVSDSNVPQSTDSANLSITVNATGQTLGITTTSLPSGSINNPYSALLTANGGVTPYSWSVSVGTLPTGLTLVGNTGQITGVPGAAGLWEFTVMATDAQNHFTTQALSIAVDTGDANATLNGSYALSFSGFDQSVPIVAVGSITADGNGHITGGETDTNSASRGPEHDQITSGSYTIDSTGLGVISWNDDHGGSVDALVAMGGAEDIRIIAYNQNGSSGTWGAGQMHQQNPASFHFQSQAVSYGEQGFDGAGHPAAGVGRYNIDSHGNVTNGLTDVDDYGTVTNNITFSGTASSISQSSGRFTVQLSLAGQTVHDSFYVISANQAVGLETDAGRPLWVITATSQSGTLNNGTLHGVGVYRGSREANAGGSGQADAVIGTVTTDGNGNASFLEDENNNGTISVHTTYSGTYSVSSNGRTVFNLGQAGTLYSYLVGPNRGWVMNTGRGAYTLFFEPQSGGPFVTSSLNGEFIGGSLPQYVPTTYDTIGTSFFDGRGNGSIIVSQSGPDGTVLNQSGSGTYAVVGSGEITLFSGTNPTGYGFMVSPAKYVGLSLDDNPTALVFVQSSAP